MSTPNDDALPTSERIYRLTGENEALREHIRRLVAENTAQRELLRQAVEAMESAIDDLAKPHSTSHGQAIAAINEHLKEQP